MLTPFTQVVLAAPPNPPVPRTLGDVAEGRRNGALPPNATVQLAPGGPWFPVDEVLSQARLLAPPSGPTRGVLAALVSVPPALALLFYGVFGAGHGYLLALWGLGFVLVLVAKADPKRETLSSGELVALVTKKPVLWYGTLLAASGFVVLATWSAAGHALEKGRAEASFNETDDCTFEEKWRALPDDARDSLTDSLKSRAQSRIGGCEKRRAETEAATYAKTCKDLVERMGKNALTKDDFEHLHRRPPALGGEYLTGEEATEFAGRIAARSLKTPDLAKVGTLPCGPSSRDAFLRAAGESPAAWTGLSLAEQAPEALLEEVSRGPITLSAAASAAVAKRLADALGGSVERMSYTELTFAVRMCGLGKALRMKLPASCATAERALPAAIAKKSDGDRESEQRRKETQLERCRSGCFTRTVREMEKKGENPNSVGGGVIGMVCEDECRESLGMPRSSW